MAISTYEELKTAIASWTNRSDLTSLLPDFIRLAEARLNRVLRTTDMEESLATTALTNGAATLPTGFIAFKELRYDGDTNYTLRPKPLEWIRAQETNTSSAPRFFAVANTQVVCWPTAGSIIGTYYKAIPALASNSTNWLLTDHPDLYLFASLVEAGLYTQESEATMAMWATKATALIDAVQRADDANQFDGGVLATRAR